MTRYTETRTGARWGGFAAPRPNWFGGSERCLCGHAAYIHTPTGRMDDTKVRGEGKCTAGPYGRACLCDEYQERKR